MTKLRDLWLQGILAGIRMLIVWLLLMPLILAFNGAWSLFEGGLWLTVLGLLVVGVLPVWIAVAVRIMRRLIPTDEPFVSHHGSGGDSA